MFRFKKYLSLIGLLFLFSCQSEIEEQDYNAQETIINSSPLISYLQRVAMVKTVGDNMVDQSSYCTIKLPYTVTVNNSAISLNTTADYQKVLDNINAYTTDNDIVKIDFPVTMVYYNYIEKFIPNEVDFNSLIAYWNLYPDLLSKINGLNINYPITINIYNSANQMASSVVIASDQTFFNFIKNLTANQYISLNYPISVTDYNYQNKSIANNIQFENAIKDAIDNAPENNIGSLDFTEVITKGYWQIASFYDKTEKASTYNDYVFVFKSNKSVVATKGGNSETGQWETKIVNGVREFKINFSFNLLYQLECDWESFEFNNSLIHLREVDNTNNTKYLYFEKKKY
ncbi:hypothetical protein [Flavobacterium eburneipallidum]|uniref:hypothetical protein n=1 Tax=Flavobacterium eburneipallidum TaxID=3003263 RepID=UPI002482B08D|nr:hypothetical protein [Flavobacterium eburneipallidum]